MAVALEHVWEWIMGLDKIKNIVKNGKSSNVEGGMVAIINQLEMYHGSTYLIFGPQCIFRRRQWILFANKHRYWNCCFRYSAKFYSWSVLTVFWAIMSFI